MKKITLSLTLFVLCFAFNLKAQSDNCNGYFAFEKGTKLDITFYDKKDKTTSVGKYEVISNEQKDGATVISFKNETYDKKGELITSGNYDITCKDGQIYADVRNIAVDMMPANTNAQVEITGDKLVYPPTLSEGQQLPDVESEVKSSTGGMTLLTVKMKLTNRKVAGFETVETPAGKFECVKITYDSEMKMGIMGTKKQQMTEYLAKGLGVIKSETREKGKRVYWHQITKLEE